MGRRGLRAGTHPSLGQDGGEQGRGAPPVPLRERETRCPCSGRLWSVFWQAVVRGPDGLCTNDRECKSIMLFCFSIIFPGRNPHSSLTAVLYFQRRWII